MNTVTEVSLTRRQLRTQVEGQTRHRRNAVRPVRDRRPPAPQSAATKPVRVLLGLGLLVGVVAMVVQLDTVQVFESNVAARLIEAVLGVDARVAGPVITVGLGSQHVFAMQVTAACSVVPLSVPLFLVAVTMLVTGRGSIVRTIPSLVAACVLLLAINAARFTVIAAMTRADGLDGFGWAHTFWGSLIALVGLTTVTLGYVAAVSNRRRTRG